MRSSHARASMVVAACASAPANMHATVTQVLAAADFIVIKVRKSYRQSPLPQLLTYRPSIGRSSCCGARAATKTHCAQPHSWLTARQEWKHSVHWRLPEP